MAKWGDANFEGLKALQKRLESLQDTYLNKFFEEASKELAARLLALVIPRTPLGAKPDLEGEEYVEAVSARGKKRKFLSAEGARRHEYWDGYMGGTLRRGWTAKTDAEAKNKTGTPTASEGAEYAKSLPIEKSGYCFIVRVINPVKYASYVEFGHRQTPGRFVPAIGKRLKSSFVEGKFFMTLSEDELERMSPSVLQKKLDKLLREALDG